MTRAPSFAAGLAGLLLLPAVRASPQSFQRSVEEAKALHESGRLAEAAEALREAARLAPSSLGVRSNLCFVLSEIGPSQEAIAQCSKAVEGGAKDSRLAYNLWRDRQERCVEERRRAGSPVPWAAPAAALALAAASLAAILRLGSKPWKSSRGAEKAFVGLCLALLALGVGLRLAGLGRSLWHDEIESMHQAVVPLRDLPSSLAASEDQAPLFLVLLHAWSVGSGLDEAALRLLPVAFGLLSLFVLWRVGEDRLGRGAGLASAAILAVHPFHVAYSQDLRPYSLAVFLTLLSCLSMTRAIETGRKRDAAAFAAAALAGLYTFYFLAFLLAAEAGLWLLESRRRSEARRAFMWSAGAIALGFAPWLPSLREQLRLPLYSWMPRPGISELAQTVSNLAGLTVRVGERGFGWGAAAPALAVLLAGGAAWAGRGVLGRFRRSALELATLGTAPTLLVLAVSCFKPMYVPWRHPIIALPFVALLAGPVLLGLRPAARLAALTIYLGAVSVPLYAYYSEPRGPEREAAAFAESLLSDGGRLLVYPGWRRRSIGYYYPPAYFAAGRLEGGSCPELAPRVVVVSFGSEGPPPDQEALLARCYAEDARAELGGARARVFARKK